MICYKEAINRSSLSHTPWYIITADDKDTARLITSAILYEAMSKYTDIWEPEPAPDIKANIGKYREMLE